jgi:hypothetical protein
MTKRVQLEFRVTVSVDDRRPEHLKGYWPDPAEYAKRFITLGAQIYGSHDIDFQDGKIVRALEIVDTEVEIVEAYEI